MPTFPKTRGQRRAFNQLMALYRQGLSVRGCTSATRAADRIAVRALIAQHGCFAAVRETLQARQGGSEVTKKYCTACGIVTDHRGDTCCCYRQHELYYCESCDKETPRDRRAKSCLEPGHLDPEEAYCRHCCIDRFFSPKTQQCLICGGKKGSSPARTYYW